MQEEKQRASAAIFIFVHILIMLLFHGE